ncbi:preprotein translocase subunit SecE [Candidatus Kuenenbacteria bacterium CG10_big_fil_rev_8_21_14_0_10_36_11]|uniref:Protein translocase subunit SecE n=1 Tax=Candidatus Kuenenbacteria bacterium CG10_big_fil_rev_8_21_14_0_10_36_11 TaxID=1974618 RepID=A0A2M6WAZ4_9BACT|nr:MAG: preprotein translocase subunit SecE [Candidatus Kuenenbacteria bacterium CG10_big_fil_rev_8_21_14_0_10_36_11]
MNKFTQYFSESKTELKKVIWPTKKQTLNHTLLVIGFSLGVAIFLGAVDFGLNKLVEVILK